MTKDDKRKTRAEASKTIHATVDQIEEGGMVVLMVGEKGETKVDIPASLLPKGLKEADELRITITIDRAATDEAQERIRKLQEELKQGGGVAQEKKDFKL
jgi:hypothetical protein